MTARMPIHFVPGFQHEVNIRTPTTTVGSPVHNTLLQALAVGPEGGLMVLLVEVLLDEGRVQL